MSPLYTAEEQRYIRLCRAVLADWARSNVGDWLAANDRLLDLGHKACVRAWRRKCAEAERRGMLRAAGICAEEAARYSSAYAGSHGAEDDTAATMAHALATAIRREAADHTAQGGDK